MGRPPVLDQKLVEKIAKKLGKNALSIVKSASGLASRKGISSEVALILLARKHNIGSSSAQRKLTSDKQLELRSFMNGASNVNAASNSVRQKHSSVLTTSMISEDDFQDPFLGVSGLSKTSTEAYQVLYLLENSLRSFISRVLLEKYGKDWWKEIQKKKSTSGIAQKVTDRKNNESANWHHGKRGVHEIYYTDYDHLLSVIRSFDVEFGPFFKKGVAKNLIGNLSTLVPTRNVTAHNNSIVKDDLERLRVYAKEWFKYMRHLHDKP